MALSKYRIPRTTINLPGGETIAVRGLSTSDISFLVQVHRGAVDDLVAAFAGRVKKDSTPDEIGALVEQGSNELLNELLTQFPMIAANVIAAACDEHEAWETALELPAPVQIEALLAIAHHTFTDIDGFKKFVGNVLGVLRRVPEAVTQNATAIPGGKKTRRSTGTTA